MYITDIVIGVGNMKVTYEDIKNSLDKYLTLCIAEPVYITKDGKIVAKLMNQTDEDEAKWFGADEEYEPLRVAEAIQAYDLDRLRMTYEEFTEMNENAAARYEYIDGEVYMLSSPSVYHQRIIARLHIEMDRYFTDKPCDVFMSPFDVILLRKRKASNKNVVQPDLLVACDWESDTNENGRYTGIPKLVVEVLSPDNSGKEMFTKLSLYADSGIEEYWIIDPGTGNTIIYRFEDHAITATRTFTGNERCESFIYPELAFRVSE